MNGEPRYLDHTLTVDERVEDLVARMTLKEKISQMQYNAKAIPHLGIPKYNWWNECLHGVGRAGIATVFPQAIGMAATWNPELIKRMGEVVSTEARAKHHQSVRDDDRGRYKGLTFWTPNINIFRDPRWGRGQETYGEDPFLTSQIAVAYIEGLQGDHDTYLKVAATAKHYAVHSGPEKKRHKFNVDASKKDLQETYLPAFKACVEAGVEAVMCAYNRVDGVPACGSNELLDEILRKEWGFGGHVVSDCGAIWDFDRPGGHKYTKSRARTLAAAIGAGCDLNCGYTYRYRPLVKAIKKGFLREEQVDECVRRLMKTRFKLGLHAPAGSVPWESTGIDRNDHPDHGKLALEVARQSIVLLSNKQAVLPLGAGTRTVLACGPNADTVESLLGNYEGTPSSPVTPLAGLRAVLGGKVEVLHEKGCDFTKEIQGGIHATTAAASKADAVIAFMGISPAMEGEQRLRKDDDRRELELPAVQREFLEALFDLPVPVILVLLNGSPVSIPRELERAAAVIEAWYPGQAGGTAVAEVIAGRVSPGGRLPVTYPMSTRDLPPIEDYAIATGGRTYKYATLPPLFPFGFGLTYASFEQGSITMANASPRVGEDVTFTTSIRNDGNLPGSDVLQLYVRDDESTCTVPLRSLAGFSRVFLEPGVEKQVRIDVAATQLACINERGERWLEPGKFTAWLGSVQPHDRCEELGAAVPASISFETTGKPVQLH